MIKRLLTVALVAMFGLGAYAYNVDDYVETKDARLKVTGENIASNNFNDKDAWSNEVGGALAANWKVENAAGPDGAEILTVTSTGAANDEGTALTGAWSLKNGIYAISFWVYSPAAASVSVTSGGTNYMSFNCGDGARQINATWTLAEAAWTQVTDTVVVNVESEILTFKATGVQEGVRLANFEIVPCEEVYDIRIAQKEVAYAQKLLDDPNFNTEDAAAQKNNVVKVINAINQNIENGQLDDATTAESLLGRMSTALVAYMNVTTEDIATNNYFNYVEDIEDMPKYNRGTINDGQQIGGFLFHGANWQHGVYRGENNAIIEGPNGKQGLPYIQKAIQAGAGGVGAGSIALANANMPAGKYYIAAEMMNANQNSKYVPSYDLEAEVKAFVGTDSVSLGTIKGEEYVKFYFVGELKEGESLEAGFWWAGAPDGALFNITKFEIRSFSSTADIVARREAWTNFKKQWDTMISNRQKMESLIGDKAYPWSQGVLNDTASYWNPKYDAEVAKGWVADDGSDAHVATLEELQDWVKQQGQDPAGEKYREYPIVRAYQNAYDKVVADNKVFGDLADDIEAAKLVLKDGMYTNNDKPTFQTAIEAAQSTLDNVKASTSDATMEADAQTLNDARSTLAAAVETFKASGSLTPIIDIDFSNNFEEVDVEGVTNYIIKGAKGQMEFGTYATTDKETHDKQWELGYGEGVCDGVLRMALNNMPATVAIDADDVPTDNDVIRIQFDYWGGKLDGTTPLVIRLQNAADENVAVLEWTSTNWVYSVVNSFNDEANTGLDFVKYIDWIGSSSQGDAAICVDNNKTSLDLIIDYKANSLQGSMTHGTKGTCNGAPVAMPKMDDNKIVKFYLSQSAANKFQGNIARRSWFDNLKIYKYPSSAEGPIFDAIKSVNVKSADDAIYTLSGVRVKSAVKPGLYIVNGKKVVIK